MDIREYWHLRVRIVARSAKKLTELIKFTTEDWQRDIVLAALVSLEKRRRSSYAKKQKGLSPEARLSKEMKRIGRMNASSRTSSLCTHGGNINTAVDSDHYTIRKD